MKKLCLIYNYAAHYRAAIFELIDKTFDCDFVFGDNYLDVKKMDYSLLRGHVTEVHNARASSFYVQRGVMRFLKHPYDCYLLLGEIRCLSTWCFLLRSRLQKDKKVSIELAVLLVGRACHGIARGNRYLTERFATTEER